MFNMLDMAFCVLLS